MWPTPNRCLLLALRRVETTVYPTCCTFPTSCLAQTLAIVQQRRASGARAKSCLILSYVCGHVAEADPLCSSCVSRKMFRPRIMSARVWLLARPTPMSKLSTRRYLGGVDVHEPDKCKKSKATTTSTDRKESTKLVHHAGYASARLRAIFKLE